MKKRQIIVITVLIALIVIAISLVIFGGKKELCGPDFLGQGRKVAYCDTSCQIDDDCQFACGCGVINKYEICDATGAAVDCIAPAPENIKCIEGKCAEVS